MWRLFFNWLFPFHCVLCRESLTHEDIPYLCRKHFCSLPLNNGPRCLRCQLPFASNEKEICLDCSQGDWKLKKVVTLYRYEEPFSQTITQFKYDKKRFLICMFEALFKEHVLKIKEECESFDLVVPVPLTLLKEKERGFNQSKLLAASLSRLFQKESCSNALKRIDRIQGVSQARLKGGERRENLKNLFSAGRGATKLQGKRILLVDDVVTTGSTANECAKVLLEIGAAQVVLFALARTPLEAQLRRFSE